MARDEKILERLNAKAVHYLGQYATTEARLEAVLKRFALRKMPDENKEQIATLIKQKVAECVALGYVDDKAYAEQKIAKMRQQGCSQRKITSQLLSVGVSREIINEALSAYHAAYHENSTEIEEEKHAALIYAKRKRLGPFTTTKKQKEGWENRQMASLARAGFSLEVARFVFAFSTAEEAENWLSEHDEKNA